MTGRTRALSLPRLRLPDGLSARLLLLTAAFAVAVEALIIAPSAASFHERWLLDRIRAAELASVGVEALPYNLVEDETAQQLLEIGGVAAVAVGEEGVRRLLLRAPAMAQTPDFIDLRRQDVGARLLDPWRTLFGDPERMIRVMARPRYRSGDFIEVVAPAQPLKRELQAFLLRSLLLSLLVSAVAGGLLYLALSLLILQPMQRVTRAIERFRDDPESLPAEPPSGRRDEIGRVEAELSRMQEEVRQALRSRARLAALGEAVARINHDLRNMLTSAQMASERLAASGDPQVAKAMPRLERALDRALALARNVLDYGKTEEAPPERRPVPVAAAIDAAGEDAGLNDGGVRLLRKAPARLKVPADPDQLHRILVNLMRNAREAIEADPERAGKGRIHVGVLSEPGQVVIRISDDGPGVPERLRENLFQPFAGTRAEGAGLGLAIARELAAGHGGQLTLVETSPLGSVFELRLPTEAPTAQS